MRARHWLDLEQRDAIFGVMRVLLDGAYFVIHSAFRPTSPGMSKLGWRICRVLIMFRDS